MKLAVQNESARNPSNKQSTKTTLLTFQAIRAAQHVN